MDKKEIAEVLSVSVRMVNNYLEKIDQDRRQERRETIERMYMECYTAQEIVEVVGLHQTEIDKRLRLLSETEMTSKRLTSANFTDDFEPPIYNIWSFGKKTNLLPGFRFGQLFYANSRYANSQKT